MKRFFPLFVIPFIFILDRAAKFMIVRHLKEGQGFAVWPGVFHVTRVNNTGAAFGMLKGSSSVLAIVSLMCVIGISAALIKDLFAGSRPDFSNGTYFYHLRSLALSLVVAGAVGNLYDRIRYGYVIDFLDLRIWPVFNIADSAICAGIFLLILSLFKTEKTS